MVESWEIFGWLSAGLDGPRGTIHQFLQALGSPSRITGFSYVAQIRRVSHPPMCRLDSAWSSFRLIGINWKGSLKPTAYFHERKILAVMITPCEHTPFDLQNVWVRKYKQKGISAKIKGTQLSKRSGVDHKKNANIRLSIHGPVNYLSFHYFSSKAGMNTCCLWGLRFLCSD